MEALSVFNRVVAVLFFVCYAYQLAYIAVPFLVRKGRPVRAKPGADKPAASRRYGILIAARNEAAVIGNLLDSIAGQTYPAKNLTVFVIADNCTDDTAEIAAARGAVVYRRQDTERVGKGYALHCLCENIRRDYPPEAFDGFFVFDADNVLDERYVQEMDKTFSSGYSIVTSYRNSKNYADNWISAGYALWFLREARYLNDARFRLGSSCAVSGTGFLVSRQVLEKHGGWNFFLLTEDIEFTVKSVVDGDRIGYCGKAVLFDEQPTSFAQSWRQRERWARGYLQVFRKYGGSLLKGMLRGRFACYDMAMSIMPAVVLSAASLAANLCASMTALFTAGDLMGDVWQFLGLVQGGYVTMFVIGAITTATEWSSIYAPWYKKVLYAFTFPLFMMTYVPISLTAIFKKVEWKPIRHDRAKTLAEIRSRAA